MFREKIKVLDCTVRDGGLMNNHDFDPRFVREVYKALSAAGIDYMEIGYKNSQRLFSTKEYGKWKFCNDQDIREVIQGIESSTKISVMVDVDRVDVDDVLPKKDSPVDMIRVATYVKDVDKAIYLVNHFADKGYETTVNIMAISRALDNELTEALQQLEKESKAQVIYIVDICLGINKFNKISDNFNNIFSGKNLNIHFCVKSQFFIYPVSSYFTQIVSFVGEEKLVNNIACGSFVRWLSIP